ncbi:MAG TPA: hypothetical protein VNB89_00085 [Gemmatimonadaceae bacterium]|nr:hypothetical protein [Gemmatimonadaceae bacterium]
MTVFPPILHGTLREHYLLLFGAAGAISMVVGSLSAWIGAQFGAERLAKRIAESQSLASGENAARFHELTQVMEGVALEVERISEGQRFATKLLSERAAQTLAAPRREPEMTTPH